MAPIYRFFVQPQVNTATKTINGYELLMKEYTPAGWRIPASFLTIDSQIIADLLVATTKILSLKVRYCSVNISRAQLMTTTIADAIIKSQQQLYPTKLVVELTEADSPQKYTVAELLPQLKHFRQQGMQLSLDDVGTGDNYFNEIEDLLPYMSEIKFALQNFQLDLENPQMQQKLHFWRAISVEYGLRLILEGVEDADDAARSQQLGIKYQQGYYFGKPQLLALPGDHFTN